jgi:hypothetical protein
MVKEKKSAEAIYVNATQQGQMAVLLQQSERTFDTFKVSHWKITLYGIIIGCLGICGSSTAA